MSRPANNDQSGRRSRGPPRGRGRDRAAGKIRRAALFHRPHPHALEDARRLSEERPRVRSGVHHRARCALCRTDCKDVGDLSAIFWCFTGWTRRGAISCCNRRGTTRHRGTFALRSPVRPNPDRGSCGAASVSKATGLVSSAWIVSTARRSSTSNPTSHRPIYPRTPGSAGTLRASASRNRFRLKRFRSSILVEHDLFGKPVSTFPDHALITSSRARASAR